MDVRELLNNVRAGRLTVEEAEKKLAFMPFENLGYALVDHHRELRNGCPEVIFCAGKTAGQVAGIIGNMLEAGGEGVLATRLPDGIAEEVLKVYPDAEWNAPARTLVVGRCGTRPTGGNVLVVTAGTSDIPVAEEAAVTAGFLGNNVEKVYDAGVAGIHRILSRLEVINRADVIIVIAGMEGALASVVGGLTDKPVIAIPTSVGYGASFGGITALLAMMNSCANGVAVVNIDNGFGAAYMANSICRIKTK